MKDNVPMPSAAENSTWILVSGSIRIMQIFAIDLLRGVSGNSWMIESCDFRSFWLLYLQNPHQLSTDPEIGDLY